jgi:replicative DNA helicase
MDNIAASGQDVIIISLEMARAELLAKSISRHTLKEDIKQFETTKHAKTTRGILTGARYANYSQQERAIIEAAIRSYGEYAEHIYIHEGMGDIGINEIREIVKNHIRLTGRKPVILIDYVQILAPYNIKATDKQNTDKAVLEMKRISRDFSIPVIGISSFNRDNYTEPVNMAAFKESGAVEYSSDVLLALQYEGMDYVRGEKKEDRGKRIRDLLEDQANKGRSGQAQSIQVKVLKHRNGSKGSTAVDFYPMFNFFCEKGKSGIEKEDAGEWKEVKAGEKTAKKPAKKKDPSQDGFTPLEFEEPQEDKTEKTIKEGKERLKKSID